jgi:hypothetical protein
MKSLDEIQGVLRDCEHGQLARSCEICFLESDNAKLKAELLAEQDAYRGCHKHDMAMEKDRDRWAKLAGKMAGALKDLLYDGMAIYEMGEKHRADPEKAKEALAAYESAAKENGRPGVREAKQLYSGQCRHQIPIGQPCSGCNR